MGGIGDLFIDPAEIRSDGFGWVQLCFLIAVYGYILYRASKLIADGSELLSVVLDPGLVGGLLLPVMGAIPDGAIVLFSGLGDDAQEQLKVGVGTLAGSTIMLVTIPWAACALIGRVDINKDGNCNYNPSKGGAKLTQGMSLTKTGVQPPSSIRGAAKICLATAVTYFIIQGPSFAYNNESTEDQASKEKYFALSGFLLSLAAFIGYSVYCVFSATAIEKQKLRLNEARKTAVSEKLVSMMTLLHIEATLGQQAAENNGSGDSEGSLLSSSDGSATPTAGGKFTPASTAILHSLFDRFDTDQSGELDKSEVKAMLLSMGMRVDAETLSTLLRDIGGADLKIQFHEFEELIKKFQRDGTPIHISGGKDGRSSVMNLTASKSVGSVQGKEAGEGENEEDEEEEEEEEEEEGLDLTPAQIKFRALLTLAVGVAMVTLFSDPMVDVLSVIGTRLDVNAFYISFIITPIVSNASELISSIQSSAKKTRKSIDMTYSQLLGAATMNNTFCLAIFLILVYMKGLAWQFSAEVMSILAVQAIIVAMTLRNPKDVLPLWKAGVILSLYPFSLLFVYILENVIGLN